MYRLVAASHGEYRWPVGQLPDRYSRYSGPLGKRIHTSIEARAVDFLAGVRIPQVSTVIVTASSQQHLAIVSSSERDIKHAHDLFEVRPTGGPAGLWRPEAYRGVGTTRGQQNAAIC